MIGARYVLCILLVVFHGKLARNPKPLVKPQDDPEFPAERREARSADEQDEITCTNEYKEIPCHTLCLEDIPNVKRFKMMDGDKQIITNYHNDLRSKVEPSATDLVKLKWDDRLAAVAGKWAGQCKTGHDRERSIPRMGLSVGQNIAVGHNTWQEAIQAWYDEVSDFQYGEDPDTYLGKGGWKDIGHFTQIVQNGTYLIGCGYAECPDTDYIRFYVCNYASGQSDFTFPYTAGERCGSCPNNCIGGLCDCGDTVCYNRGSLDLATCTCSCPPLYKGDNCEKLNCPEKDKWMCGDPWPEEYCDRFINVPLLCPFMCGLCEEEDEIESEEEMAPETESFTSSFGCVFTGVREDNVTCLQYGDGGVDTRLCASEDGPMGCEYCSEYQKEFCPVMCGLCYPPCNGLPCKHDGSLDPESCTCSCQKPFSGKSCQNVTCPDGGDPDFCDDWPRKYCRKYPVVQEDCPYKCGICK